MAQAAFQSPDIGVEWTDAYGGSARPADPRAERVADLCDRIIEIASALFNVSGRDLRDPQRASNSVARVRQIAMYVTHVTFGVTMKEVGQGFGRDRTTVMHACHTVEDLRDDEEFDGIVAMMEKIASAALWERRAR